MSRLPSTGGAMIAPWPEPAERRRAPELDEHGAAVRGELGLSSSTR